MELTTEMTETTRTTRSFNAWYGRNAESFNAERRERYQSDASIRAKARVQAALYRQSRAERGNPIPDPRGGLNTTTRTAAILGITRQTLMNWEKRKLIPKPTNPGKHRLYTDKQVDLLADLVEASGSPTDFTEASQTLWAHWVSND